MGLVAGSPVQDAEGIGDEGSAEVAYTRALVCDREWAQSHVDLSVLQHTQHPCPVTRCLVLYSPSTIGGVYQFIP